MGAGSTGAAPGHPMAPLAWPRRWKTPAPSTVTIDWTTQDLSATAPDDYVADSGTVTIEADQKVGFASIIVNGDDHDEGPEAFLVGFHDPVGATIGGLRGFGAGIIVDDDQPLPTSSGTPTAIAAPAGSAEGDRERDPARTADRQDQCRGGTPGRVRRLPDQPKVVGRGLVAHDSTWPTDATTNSVTAWGRPDGTSQASDAFATSTSTPTLQAFTARTGRYVHPDFQRRGHRRSDRHSAIHERVRQVSSSGRSTTAVWDGTSGSSTRSRSRNVSAIASPPRLPWSDEAAAQPISRRSDASVLWGLGTP